MKIVLQPFIHNADVFNQENLYGYINPPGVEMELVGIEKQELAQLRERLKKAQELEAENTKLKELLKECREHLITYKRDDLDKGYVIYDGSYLIDKINQALGEDK